MSDTDSATEKRVVASPCTRLRLRLRLRICLRSRLCFESDLSMYECGMRYANRTQSRDCYK